MSTNDAVTESIPEPITPPIEPKQAFDDASSSIKDVANKYGQKADEAVQYASQTYHDAKDVAQQHIGDLERQIRDKPVQAALIAFGVGFVVGTLLTR